MNELIFVSSGGSKKGTLNFIEGCYKIGIHNIELSSGDLINIEGIIKYAEQKSESLSVFVIWGHSWEFDQNITSNNWDYFESILKALTNTNDIWFTTAGDFAEFYHQTLGYRSGIASESSQMK